MLTDHPGQNSIFITYVAILLGVLGLAAVVMACLTFFFHLDLRRVWKTYGSWLVLAPLAFGAIYLGRLPTILLFVLFAIAGFKEFARATGLYRDWWMTGTGYFLILATGFLTIVRDPSYGTPGWYGFYMALPAYAVALLVLIPIVRNQTHGQLQIMALAVTGYVLIGWMFLHLALLANIPNGAAYLLYLLLAVELNDVAAFTFGSLLGRRKKHLLRSRISPKKTWEGAIGALVLSMILPWVLRFTFPQFSHLQLILTGLIVGVGGQLGDLCMSVIKRDLEIKDMGSLIPGHGGMLDRIDSLIYAGPLFLHMIRFFSWYGRTMSQQSWQYPTAGDLGQSWLTRLRRVPREPDMLVYGLRAIAALPLRGLLRTYHRLQITGRQHLPTTGSFVMVANHASHLDALCLLSAIPLSRLHHTFPAAAQDYFFDKGRKVALAAIFANAIPFGRKVNLRKSLTLCRQLLATPGNVLILFPEGTRTTTGQLGTFRPGIGRLLAGSNVPVVPCAIQGAFESWPKGAWFPRPRKISLQVGQRRQYTHLPPGRESSNKIATDLHAAVRDLLQ